MFSELLSSFTDANATMRPTIFGICSMTLFFSWFKPWAFYKSIIMEAVGAYLQ